MPLQLVADFVTLVATYSTGFMVILEPYQPRTPHIPDPMLQLACLGTWAVLTDPAVFWCCFPPHNGDDGINRCVSRDQACV